ncbi:YihY/virulence factor BrkB family protein [Flavobacteriaceae bacterium AU392]|nr:YihY/virulence factor BrkB family protein [Flavobacteriaceae bacterium]RKM83496.1 YihY/virulence factor BrkB family protein [Flavobacteriaceae bacterium AU392]
MTKPIEDKIDKIPILNLLARFLKQVKLPGFEGLSIYDLLEMYSIGIIKGALTARAGAIAYSFFMAIFPFLLFVIILIPHIPIENFETEFLGFLESFLPPTTTDFFSDTIFNNINGAGLISSVFFVSMLLMANGVNAVFSGFENSYHEQLTRNMFRQYLYAFWVALILAFLLILTVAGLGYFEIYVIKTGFAKYGFFIIMVYLATAVLYYFGTKEGRHSKFFSVGALFTTLLIIINSYLFGIYIDNFAQYNKLYGSIGALLILLFYLWLNSNIILLGFELNVSLRLLRAKCK